MVTPAATNFWTRGFRRFLRRLQPCFVKMLVGDQLDEEQICRQKNERCDFSQQDRGRMGSD
jgi:hypothetical protein